MVVLLDILRGFVGLIFILAAMVGVGWLILPPISDHSRVFTAIMGGGALLFFMVVVLLSNVTIKP